MKIINTKGIPYFEPLEGSTHWYWGTDYIHGDLYEAEYLFQQCHKIKSNTLLFLRYPQGEVVEPIPPKEGQYFGRPLYHEGHILLLLVDFQEQQIYIKQYNEQLGTTKTVTELPLASIKDCYNLMMKTAPLMLIRQGNENQFEMLYPNNLVFSIENHESFDFRKDDILYFTTWTEDDVYQEEVILRDATTGEILERRNGSLRTMPDGQIWVFV